MSKKGPNPFNGKWGLSYSSDFETYMEAFEMNEETRKTVREALKNYGEGRLIEEWNIDEEAGTISRTVSYQGILTRVMTGIPYNEFRTTKFFDGSPIEYMWGREGDNRNMLSRFDIHAGGRVHSMIFHEVNGDTLISTYCCRGHIYMKKFDRLPEHTK